MNNIENFLEEEKNKYENMYVNINYAIDSITDFVSRENLKRRKYVLKIEVIKNYLKQLDHVNLKLNKKSFFRIFDNQNKYINNLEKYKNDNSRDFKQLSNCLKCSCLKCIKECNFDTCLGCRFDSKIVYCDHDRINVTSHSNFILNLVNNNTNKENKYEVLAAIQDLKENKRYIVIRNIHDFNDKFILHYYPGISGDNYGEITDSYEFDYIVDIFNSCNLE